MILRENLKRLDDQKLLAQYQAIVAAEATSLHSGSSSVIKIPTGSR